MPHFGYIIQSEVDGSYYIGEAHDADLRLEHHNDGWTRSTKGKRPWRIVYVKRFATRAEALRWEKDLKRKKSRKCIERLIRQARGRPDIL